MTRLSWNGGIGMISEISTSGWMMTGAHGDEIAIPPIQRQTRQKEQLPVQGNSSSKVDKVAARKQSNELGRVLLQSCGKWIYESLSSKWMNKHDQNQSNETHTPPGKVLSTVR